MSLPLSKLPTGVLNNRIREKIYQGIDINKDNFMKVLRRVVSAQFGEQYTVINRDFTAVCIQVLEDEEKQSLVSAGYFDKIADTNASNLERKTACRVYIPELHTDRALPDDIYKLSKRDKSKIQAFFPVFISETEEIATKPLQVGQLLQVKIKNNNGGGSFLYFLNDTNSRVNIFNENRPSNDLFRCEIFRFSRIVNAQGRSISLGEVITSEKNQSSNKLDKASLKQQYKKYLSEKEIYWYKTLKEYWTDTRFKGLADELTENIVQSNNTAVAKLVWLLLQKLSVYSPTGIVNAGLTVLNVDSIDDSYGIFKHTKEQFDSFTLKYQNKTIPLVLALPNTYAEELDDFYSELVVHSDLLDPYLSTAFFLLDFANYLDEKGKRLENVALNLDQPANQKLVTNYFTKNDNRIQFIFSSDYTQIIKKYDNITGDDTSQKPNLNSISQNPAPFPTFGSWLTQAAGGAAVNIEDFVKDEIGSLNNPQVLDVENPRDTKDECHSNYPQRNSYLEHVDAQKAQMRKYIESSISGEDLNFLSNTHKGVKNIVMADIKIQTPFKVIRYDGASEYPQDQNRWFNAENDKNLLKVKTYDKFYYRAKKDIRKITVTTLNLKRKGSNFYKNDLKLLYDLNKPMPHFLVTPSGQIIQLVDAAAVVDNELDNKKSSIVIAFAEEIGNIGSISGENNNVLDNYILVNPDKTFNNVYRPHKIGTKASLEAAHKLIQFLMTQTDIKYDLAAQDFEFDAKDISRSSIQAYGHYKGIAGMNFIYYAWTYELAYKNGGTNILSKKYGYN